MESPEGTGDPGEHETGHRAGETLEMRVHAVSRVRFVKRELWCES